MNAIAQASAAPARGPKLDNRRVLAGIVDLLIVGVGAAAILFAADALSGDRGDVQGALSAVMLGWALYYYFALESGGGQTVGKKLMKLRVVRLDGSPVGMREVAVRTILRVVDGAGAYIVGLIVMLATGERRQRIGDLAAGTIVVDASSPARVAAVAAPVAEAAEADVPEAGAESGDEGGQGGYAAPEAGPDADAEPQQSAEPATITLPARPAPPATVDDLAAPQAPDANAVPVMAEPAAEAEDALAAEDELPEITSPAVEELARDVAAAHSEPEPEPVPVVEAEPSDEGPVSVKSVETVSAIDLIMGGAESDADADPTDDAGSPPQA